MAKARRVLVVDDDYDILEVYRLVLEHEGYDVVTAHNGQEALDRLHRSNGAHTSLILLDLMMPIMDGWEFRARQLSEPALRGIPVVVFSGDHRALETPPPGIAAVLAKPVSMHALLTVIDHHGR